MLTLTLRCLTSYKAEARDQCLAALELVEPPCLFSFSRTPCNHSTVLNVYPRALSRGPQGDYGGSRPQWLQWLLGVRVQASSEGRAGMLGRSTAGNAGQWGPCDRQYIVHWGDWGNQPIGAKPGWNWLKVPTVMFHVRCVCVCLCELRSCQGSVIRHMCVGSCPHD